MFYIRTDMNDTIATGHVMRCLAIADAAQKLGEQVRFIVADKQAVSYIRNRGYESIVLNTTWKVMEQELSELTKIIQKYEIKSILVDSYQVTENYLKQLSKMTKVLYIDDLNAFHYPVSVVICYANYWDKFCYPQNYHDTKLYLGTIYTPLRKAFQSIGKKVIREKVDKLLLMSGGNDEKHILARVLDMIDKTDYVEITVLCGRYYTEYDRFVDKYTEYENVHIYRSVADIEIYMRNADLAVSAGGTTLYELCACGTPTISYALADNQLDNVRKFAEDGIIDYAGDVRCDNVPENINELIRKYSADMELRRKRSEKMQLLIDGNGADRIVEVWKKLMEE